MLLASSQPFRIGVHFDGDEYIANTLVATMPANAAQTADVHEVKVFPGGIIGLLIFKVVQYITLILKCVYV